MIKIKQFFINIWAKIKKQPFQFIGRVVLFVLALVILICSFLPRAKNNASAAYAADFEDVQITYPYSYYGWFFVKSASSESWLAFYDEYANKSTSDVSILSTDYSNSVAPFYFSAFTSVNFSFYPMLPYRNFYINWEIDDYGLQYVSLSLWYPLFLSTNPNDYFFEKDIYNTYGTYTSTVPFTSNQDIYVFFAIPKTFNLPTWFDTFINEFTIPLSAPYGYPQGYELGYEAGLIDGQAEAYNRGYEAGKRDGLAEGYSEGIKDGEEQGYNKGFQDGLNQGTSEGYSQGYEAGYSVGFLDSSAYESGYNAGFTAGRAAGRNEALTEGLTNPVVYVLQPVVTFFDTKLFGVVSIGQILSIFIFVAVGLIFLKMFAGG